MNEASYDCNLLSVEYGGNDAFPLGSEERLLLTVTNVHEFALAFDNGWPGVGQLALAFSEKLYTVIYLDDSIPEVRRLAKVYGFNQAIAA